jgi:transcription elongation factor GreA
MNTTSEYISQEKLNSLKEELEYLKNDKRKELAENLQRARALGDLSENAEYHSAREEQGFAEDRIKQIEHIIKTANIVKTVKSNGVVQVGSIVEIKKKGDRVSKKIEIVGGEESDTLAGKISYKSPLGQAVYGQIEGAQVSVHTPKGENEYKIVSVK